MKIFNIKTIFLAAAFFSFIGCSKDYLETEPSENYSTSEQINKVSKVDPKVSKYLINGLYGYMTQAFVGGTKAHEDFGQKGNDIISDMLSCDMAYKNAYNRYRNVANLTAMDNYRSLTPNYIFWRYYYKIIYQANAIIANYGGNEAIPEKNEDKWFLAQAKAMRAYAYLYLTMYYTTEYNSSEKVLVLYKEQADKAKPQSTTKEVMDFVIKDLTESINLFEGFQRQNKSAINKNVAKGLLVYTYAFMGEYDKVIPLTNDIITSGEFTLTPKKGLYSGMNSIADEKGWMWGVDIISDMKLDLVSFWGQIDIFSYSYAAYGGHKRIDEILYNKIKDTDLRKGQFLPPTSKGFPYVPYKKFFAPERQLRGTKKIMEEDYVYMRVAEFYLLKAEAEAKLGLDAAAIETLKPLLMERYETEDDFAYITSKTGEELQNEIYLQTRIELWGEGKSYFAMKRNKATVYRGGNHTHLPNTSYQYNDSKLTLDIPNDEVENNPNITK